MSNNFLQDALGNKSSKRLWGSITLAIAIILSIVVVITSVYLGNPIHDNVVSILHGFFAVGTGLLGVGVLEVFGKSKK